MKTNIYNIVSHLGKYCLNDNKMNMNVPKKLPCL